MSVEKLKGQFLKGNMQKLKKVNKNNTVSYNNEVSAFGGYKCNGHVLPKRGAL